MKRRAPRSILRILAVVALLGLGFAAAMLIQRESAPEVCEAIKRRRLTRVYTSADALLRCPGVEARDLAGTGLAEALLGRDPQPLSTQLLREKASGVGLRPSREGKAETLGDKLRQLMLVPALRAVVLAPELAVYAPVREPELSMREREALAYVARALFRGAREPSFSSFPPALRRVERVEVMVTLSEHGEPRLWRSARGTSVARTLLTATRVARDRWHEREQAMGGPLSKRLLHLDVEVSLLSEDGTLASTQGAFVDRAITPQHGLGFDFRNGWHYMLPEDVQRRGKGSAYKALKSLLSDQGLGPSALHDPNMRLYRFVPLMLGVSKAPLPKETPADE